jgi:CHAT domain-containing protein
MFEGEVLLNENFKKEETLRVWRDKQFPVIHIASHFKFHPTKPEESFLLLGDGELKIADIKNEDNLFDGVDLLALSACDTAMSANGKESESFAYVAQDLGAKTVLASLWPVSDVGTPELMTRFYTLRAANPSMTKGEAFYRAQVSLVRGEKVGERTVTKPPPSSTNGHGNRAEKFAAGSRANLPLFVRDPARPFAHPFYWAPFVLIGNWR